MFIKLLNDLVAKEMVGVNLENYLILYRRGYRTKQDKELNVVLLLLFLLYDCDVRTVLLYINEKMTILTMNIFSCSNIHFDALFILFIMSAAFSATINVVAMVFPDVTLGNTEASTTLRPAIP